MTEVYITTGFLLDLIFGDPVNFPHPVRLIGRLINFLEGPLRNLRRDRFAGILLLAAVAFSVYAASYLLSNLSFIIEIILIYTVFAVKSLGNEALKIYSLLEKNNMEEAKRQLGYIVSRDTGGMSESDVIRATVETVSENTVDGIISPMFYLFLGGAPLAMMFKGVSTLDSMVGYKNEKYIDFGWASARMDDLMNFIPARITAFILIPIAAIIHGMSPRNVFGTVKRDRLNHSSPNSGHSEAAFAGALGCRLGGPSSYSGKITDKPYIGDNSSELDRKKITESVKLMYTSSVTGLVMGTAVLFLIG